MAASKQHTVLALSEENWLLEITIPKGPSKILAHHDYNFNPGCSFSPPVDKRVYLVGGYNRFGEYSLDCFYYDLIDLGLYRGPPINFPKWLPSLILLGSSLFAFSCFKEISKDSEPICEVLDTASTPLEWCPLNTFPVLPSPPPVDICSYLVVSYATYLSSRSLFLSFGNTDSSITYCYDDYGGRWSNFSETRLPFLGEGKFVGIICYAFSRTDYKIDNSSYLAAYNLSIDWETDARVYCVELCRYPLLDGPPYGSPYDTFFASDLNVFTIVRTKLSETYGFVKEYSFEVDVVRLSPPQHNSRLADSVSVPLPLSSLPLFPPREHQYTLPVPPVESYIIKGWSHASVLPFFPPIEKQFTLPVSPPLESDIIEGSSHALKRKRRPGPASSDIIEGSSHALKRKRRLPFFTPLPPLESDIIEGSSHALKIMRRPGPASSYIIEGSSHALKKKRRLPFFTPLEEQFTLPVSHIIKGSSWVLKHNSIRLPHDLKEFLGEYN